jgi:hypothetical protein
LPDGKEKMDRGGKKAKVRRLYRKAAPGHEPPAKLFLLINCIG